ncbi:tail tape measure protein [Novosphingobium album (ex Hu et al. 2023)]|uniref:Tail tape measure protein n=1 Tax=Novosphingobium album (ex Hu et al. 2023) TaxID=2930093 RepID=A0ABT0B0W7_9SPHN|nr:tail tape measure protein [Novosphingobium album (ex Hu et al. 2023)]MCJ2178682.1 tail tape measure protein [Novosphingobium album (ex Hu et al. 2023)]
MTDEIDSLLVDVRASTDGFARDIATKRSAVDGDLVPGFTKAGDALEKGLAGAIRSGSLGFDDLKRVALSAFDEIAAQAAQTLVSSIGGSPSGSNGFFNFAGLLSSVLGLPGRATGGNVSPGRGYVVGEKGPELFVPTSAGRVETSSAPASRDVRVAINVTAPRTSSTPQSLQRSARQVASAVRRALSGN